MSSTAAFHANSFEVFALILLSMLLASNPTIRATTALMSNNKLILITALFAVLTMALFIKVSIRSIRTSIHDALYTPHLRALATAHQAAVAELKESHRRHLTTVKYEHQKHIHELQSSLHSSKARFDRAHYDYEFMADMYQDSIRVITERDARIAYLETKFREQGHMSPVPRVPFSAPATQVTFALPRMRGELSTPPRGGSSLATVGEVAEE